jgi:protein-S-isoprenylcysteine O-methyltransferase Ste14
MMNGEESALLLLLLAWIAFFLLHSLLAAHGIKRAIVTKFPAITPCYRLFYNLFALLSLLPIIFIHALADATPVLQWRGTAEMILRLLSLGALFCFIWSLRYYDLRNFSGISACLHNSLPAADQLTISPLHRFVRHPWYCCAIVIIWCRDQNSLELLSSVMVSAYFYVGARLEEKKLIRDYGEVYQTYMHLVPGLMPRPGKTISKGKAEELMRLSAETLSATPPAPQDR